MQNILGTPLQKCSTDPLTGWDRSGYCHNEDADAGHHLVCAVMTDSFLQTMRGLGNDLVTPSPPHFPGLKEGDRWCVCASRFSQAEAHGVAPPVIAEATHSKAERWAAVREAV